MTKHILEDGQKAKLRGCGLAPLICFDQVIDLMDKTDKNEPASRILLENKFQFLTSNKHGWHSKAFRQIRLL